MLRALVIMALLVAGCDKLTGLDDFAIAAASTASVAGAGGASSASQGGGGEAGSLGGGGGVAPECGNGVIEAGEECDDGNAMDDDGCDSHCLVDCESGVKRPATNHCYWLVETYKEWSTAMTDCSQFGVGAHLSTIVDQAERDFVDAFIPSTSPSWLGGYESEGWLWITGEPWDYAPWDTNEPDAGSIGSCLLLQQYPGNANDRFAAEPCVNHHLSICERPPAGAG